MFGKFDFVAAGMALAVFMMSPAPRAQAQPGPPIESPATPGPETPGDAPAESETIAPIEVPARPTLILRGKSKWDDGYKALTDAFRQLRAEAAKVNVKINGRPLAVFVHSDDEGFSFEAMLPVELPAGTPPNLTSGITTGSSPGGQALKFEHRGAYEDIESTYEAIAAYLDEKGLAARDELIEEFLNEPAGADDANLEIDIYVLLKP